MSRGSQPTSQLSCGLPSAPEVTLCAGTTDQIADTIASPDSKTASLFIEPGGTMHFGRTGDSPRGESRRRSPHTSSIAHVRMKPPNNPDSMRASSLRPCR